MDLGIWGAGDPGIWGAGDPGIWGAGDPGIWGAGDPGDLGGWGSGDPGAVPADGESDGPDHLHIVLVDNGRSRLLGGELAEILYCIRCGACLNACPVYQEIGGHAYGSVYPGPVGAVLTPGLRGLEAFPDLPQASSLCGACREICPVRIDIPRMLLALRDRSTAMGYSATWATSGLWLFRQFARRPWAFRAAQGLARRVTRLLASRDGWIRWLPGHLSGWTRQRDFPAFASKTFLAQWASRR